MNPFLWLVPKARHNKAVMVAPELYSQRTVAFFQQYLLNVKGSEDSAEFEDISKLKAIDED